MIISLENKMKTLKSKLILSALLSVLILIAVSPVGAQSPRLSCSNLTATIELEAPSTNSECLTVVNNEAAPAGQSLTLARISSASILLKDFFKENKIAPEATAFSVSGLSSVNPEIYQHAVNLTAMINAANEGAGTAAFTAPIPFLPYQESTQLVQLVPMQLDPINGSGIRFVTAYGNQGDPVSNDNLFYTFQGMSQDGRFYLSVTIPISNTMISGPTDPTTVDWTNVPADSWQPALETLDDIVLSIQVR
jgi:hypothetical protein